MLLLQSCAICCVCHIFKQISPAYTASLAETHAIAAHDIIPMLLSVLLCACVCVCIMYILQHVHIVSVLLCVCIEFVLLCLRIKPVSVSDRQVCVVQLSLCLIKKPAKVIYAVKAHAVVVTTVMLGGVILLLYKVISGADIVLQVLHSKLWLS